MYIYRMEAACTRSFFQLGISMRVRQNALSGGRNLLSVCCHSVGYGPRIHFLEASFSGVSQSTCLSNDKPVPAKLGSI